MKEIKHTQIAENKFINNRELAILQRMPLMTAFWRAFACKLFAFSAKYENHNNVKSLMHRNATFILKTKRYEQARMIQCIQMVRNAG